MSRRLTNQPRKAKPFTRKGNKRKAGRCWKWILLLLMVFLLIPVMQVALVRFIRVKGFAPRGCRGRKRAGVLRIHLAVGERFRFLHWVHNQLARALEAASRQR